MARARTRFQPSRAATPKVAPPTASRFSRAQARVAADGSPDGLRREIAAEWSAKTGRSLVLYASAFHVPSKALLNQAQLMGMGLADISGFREVLADLPKGAVDVVLHTPGGLAETAEGVAALLRSKFDDVRFLIPLAAKSAGTMLAMSGNSIVALTGAELGPIDPQFPTAGGRLAPARAIEKQFDKAIESVTTNPKSIPAWVPLLSPLSPALLEECQSALKLSQELVSAWLEKYMFGGRHDAHDKATQIAAYLADYELHRSHGRPIQVQALKDKGVEIALASDVSAELDDLLSRLWVALELTLGGTDVYKMFENHLGQGLFSKATVQKVEPKA